MHHIYITLRKCLFNFFTQLWKSNIFIITNFSCKRLEAMTTLCVINDRASKFYILVTMFLLISSYQTNRMEISFTHSTCYGVEFKKCHANCDRQDRTLAVCSQDTRSATQADRQPAAKCSRPASSDTSPVSTRARGKAQYVHFCLLLISSFLLHIDLLFHIATKF